MEGTDFLSGIVIIFGLTVAILFVCYRFRIPTVVGFLLSGMMVGPHGFGLVGTPNSSLNVNVLADIGVIILLFTIGMEFSLQSLARIRNYALIGGSLQVFLTLGVVALLARMSYLPWGSSFFIGFLVCLSSTAIVLKILQGRDEINSPHGRFTLAVLIFQDIVVVPMMLLVPIMAGQGGDLSTALLMLLLKGVGIIVLTLLSAQYIMPRVLFQVVSMRSQEIFLICIIVICFSIAWFTSALGLSLSLGAFLAGLIISESEYSHQALSIILPFRNIFTSFFFISIGMLMDVHFFLAHPVMILTITFGILLVKTLVAGLSAFSMGFPIRTITLTAFALNQVGEFSFVLSKTGLQYKLIDNSQYQGFLAVSILTMALSPFLIPTSYKLSEILSSEYLPGWIRHGWRKPEDSSPEIAEHDYNDHLIIVGYGITGKNLSYAARSASVPYVILEMNAETVKTERRKGEPIFYGDATQESILQHVLIKKAKVLVVAVPDPVGTRAIVALARSLNRKLYIIVRTHYMREISPLLDLGANEVIPEEFETSIEIFSIVLTKYLVPEDQIDNFITHIRADRYEALRSQTRYSATIGDLQQQLQGIDISTFTITNKSSIAGRSIGEIGLRQNYGVNLLAILRNKEVISTPDADTVLSDGDKIIVSGKPDEIFVFSEVLFGKKHRGRTLTH